MKSRYDRHHNTKIEIILVILIALCMIVLIGISDQKIDEILGTRDSIILRENPTNEMDEELAKEIKIFKSDACTLMEVYDENFNLVLDVPFTDEHSHGSLKNQIELQKLFKTYQEGHTRTIIEDQEEDIYFRWTTNDRNEPRLVIMYMTRPVVKYLWLIPSICYLILILIFILLVRLHLIQQNEKITHYQTTSRGVQNIILK